MKLVILRNRPSYTDSAVAGHGGQDPGELCASLLPSVGNRHNTTPKILDERVDSQLDSFTRSGILQQVDARWGVGGGAMGVTAMETLSSEEVSWVPLDGVP